MLLVALTLLGGLQWLAGLWAGWLPDAPLLQQIAIVVSVVILTSLIEIPIDAYRQFRLEAKFGFNRMTPRLFFADLLKSTALGAAIGIPLLAAVLWLMQQAGDYWWLWAWVLWTAFNLVILLIYPTRDRAALQQVQAARGRAPCAAASKACCSAAALRPTACS